MLSESLAQANSSLARRRLRCQLSANKREAETSANVKKNIEKHVKDGTDVITNVISANQPFASTFSIFKIFNSRDVVASSPSLSRSSARAPRRVACPQANPNLKTAFFRKKIDPDPAFY